MALPPGICFFTPFITGSVYFKDDTRAVAKMNYNRLYDEMLFLDPKGDTLALKDENNIKFIALDKDTFYYNGGYIPASGRQRHYKVG
jgi:hypothetical protein